MQLIHFFCIYILVCSLVAGEVKNETSDTYQMPDLPGDCPAQCNKNGTCHELFRRCDCLRTRKGEDCSIEYTDMPVRCKKLGFKSEVMCTLASGHHLCLNGCNMRGRCYSGFCLCDPGFFGSDCSLSLNDQGIPALLDGARYQERSQGPSIYVYELPPRYNTWFANRLDRSIHLYFWQRLLGSGVRTADPEQADYFFIPVPLRHVWHSSILENAIKYIRKKLPYWDRWDGGRHLIIHTGDMGRSDASEEVRALTAKSIWLTHWGLTQKHSFSGWPASHRHEQDIVLPVYLGPWTITNSGLHHSPLNPQNEQPTRPTTFYFSGRVCSRSHILSNASSALDLCGPGGHKYSGGVRQKVYLDHRHRSGWSVLLSSRTYGRDMATAKFCLAPPGGGHGKRQVLVSLMGCVPVVIGDNILQPFEPALRWDDFSVNVKEADIPRLHEILAKITPDQLQEKQRRLQCAAQHLFYTSMAGTLLGDDGRYDAFETLMQILRVKRDKPHLPPEKYREDEEFARFINCNAGSHLNLQPLKSELCAATSGDGKRHHPPPCRSCVTLFDTQLLLPGGATCCNHTTNIADCPRLWI